MTQDVNQAETTAEAPSAENTTDMTTQDTDQGDSDSASKTVPYERFQEVISSKNELKQEIDNLKVQLGQIQETKAQTPTAPPNPQEEQIKGQLDKYLKELGYVSKQELEQKEADKELAQSIESLSKKYDGKNGLPKFDKTKAIEFAQKNLIGDLESAYKLMNEAAIMDNAIKAALGKTKGVRTEVSDGSGSADVGTSQTDLKNAAMSGDKDAMETLIRRSIS